MCKIHLQAKKGKCMYVCCSEVCHYNDVIMSVVASQITSLTIVHPTVYSGADQRKHQSSASLAFVWGIHRWLVNSPHKRPVMRKMFPFDDVIMSIVIQKLLLFLTGVLIFCYDDMDELSIIIPVLLWLCIITLNMMSFYNSLWPSEAIWRHRYWSALA